MVDKCSTCELLNVISNCLSITIDYFSYFGLGKCEIFLVNLLSLVKFIKTFLKFAGAEQSNVLISMNTCVIEHNLH